MKKLNRDEIKYLAIVTMVFNHVANAGLVPEGTLLHDAFINIGYFTAITMCYFLVEGFHYTHDLRKYVGRILLFGAAAQIPYAFCFPYHQLDMFFSLAVCLLILAVSLYMLPGFLRWLLLLLLLLVSLFCDWGILAPIFTVVFERYRGNRRALKIAWPCLAALVGFTSLTSFTPYGILNACFAGLFPLLAGVVILNFYNGERFDNHRAFHRWFFYVFYPAHLTVIAIIKWKLGI